MAYTGEIAREANIRTGNPINASRADDNLNDEFADYLLKQRPTRYLKESLQQLRDTADVPYSARVLDYYGQLVEQELVKKGD